MTIFDNPDEMAEHVAALEAVWPPVTEIPTPAWAEFPPDGLPSEPTQYRLTNPESAA